MVPLRRVSYTLRIIRYPCSMDFYQGKVLRVDLERRYSCHRAAQDGLGRALHRRQRPSSALHVGVRAAPRRSLGSREPVFLVTGPFAGTNVSTASRLVVGAKSPATGILDDSYVGGSFAPEMKFAGYDLIIITGKAAQPTVLWIKDDKVEFLPAAGQVLGPQDLRDRSRPCAPTSTRTPRCSPSVRRARTSFPGPA